MRVHVRIFVNEILLANLPNTKFEDLDPGGPVTSTGIDIELFGQKQSSRQYPVNSWTVLPCEQFKFAKVFFNCTSIKEILQAFDRESVNVRVWMERLNTRRREIIGHYDSDAFRFFYPYVTILKPSYDRLSRRVPLVPLKVGSPPAVVQLTLSIEISEGTPDISPERQRSRSQERLHSPLNKTFENRPVLPKLPIVTTEKRPLSSTVPSTATTCNKKPSRLPGYMRPTFCSMMAEHVTREQFHASKSVDDLRNFGGSETFDTGFSSTAGLKK